MEDLSLHILDVVENSVAASAATIEILIVEDTVNDRLSLEIRDDGVGMEQKLRERALDPFFSTRPTRRIGLGLPLLAQAARDSGGDLELESEPGKGTTVLAVFQLSHPDRKPLGDIAASLVAILAGKPHLDVRFEYERDGELVAGMDSRQLVGSETE